MAAPLELPEKCTGLLAVDDAGERGVLPRHTDAGMTHHHDQEARLPRRKPERRQFLDLFLCRQPNISSASPAPRPPPLPPPPRLPSRTLMPRYAVNPDRAAAAP